MQETFIHILLVEDNIGDTHLLRQMLADTPLWKALLTCTERLQLAIELCKQQPFEVILLDLSLPDSRGYATFERMRQHAPQTPIILLTGSDDQALALRAVRAGAQDYLIKGEINAHLLIRAMRYAIERKRSEEVLREHHLRYQALFENDNIGVFIVSVAGLLLNLNQQAAVMLGSTVEQLLDTAISNYIVPDEYAEFYQQTQALLQGSVIPIQEYTFVRGNGSALAVEIDSTLVRNANGEVLYIQSIARDITKRKEAEMALQAERALLAQRVEERTKELSIANVELMRNALLKNEFLATVSHELRTPLSVILASSDALQDEIYGPIVTRQRKALERIIRSGRHLLDLINDIIDVSKIESGKLTLEIGPVSATNLSEDCVQMVQEMAKSKQINITNTVQLTNDIVHADGRRLMQILLNLLNNAVKFTPDNGQIGLDVYEEVEQQLITFTVWDTGIGITEEDIRKLFRPFVQLDSKLSRQYQGAGLGLALVYRLTELHGGSVTVHSTLNQGSRFTITLPHHAKSARDGLDGLGGDNTFARAMVPLATTGEFSSLVLLADDNPVSTNHITHYLEGYGCRVILAPNSTAAVAQAQELLPDLILINIQMPQLDGLAAIRQLRQFAAFAHTPIITLTSLILPGDRELCLAAGADDYMRKPVHLQALEQRLIGQKQREQAMLQK